MKKNISPGIIVGLVTVVVLIIGFFAYKTFFTSPDASDTSPAAKAAVAEAYKNSSSAQRQGMRHSMGVVTPPPASEPGK